MNLHKLIRFCLFLDDIISLKHKMLDLLKKGVGIDMGNGGKLNNRVGIDKGNINGLFS
jgi:hypothetical protein